MEIPQIFSDYRHEWAIGDFTKRFVKPPYYQQFASYQPAFLIGGRGTGKTVTLRSLNFRNSEIGEIQTGIYIKAFKNRVEAFTNANIDLDLKSRAFEHYINLLCCFELTELILDLSSRIGNKRSINRAISLAATHFSFTGSNGKPEILRNHLRLEIARLSAFLNDPCNLPTPTMSQGELPVVDLARDINKMISNGRPLYICIDEWENLSDTQQEKLNRWIKNCERPITFKIGVREGGIRSMGTGGNDDPLHTPADYTEIRIAGQTMKSFCEEVVEQRLTELHDSDESVPAKLNDLLESLNRQSEAVKLRADLAVKRAIKKIQRDQTVTEDSIRWIKKQTPGDAYLAVFIAERSLESLNIVIEKAIEEPEQWQDQKNNYGHVSLYSITRGARGSTRRKFYAGARTFIELSDGNVRYLLELLDEAVSENEMQNQDELDSEHYHISAEVQTQAAINVAKRRLRQIEVYSDRGLEILRLVMSLGTTFGTLVRQPSRRAPECTSFTLTGNLDDINFVIELLNEGCAILAFVRETTTKHTSPTELKGYEYRIHPVLAPHFCIPYRKKRRSKIDAADLKEVLDNPGSTESLVTKLVGELKSEHKQNMLF